MRKLFEIGGLAAAAVLIVFGVVAIAMGVNGRHTVQNSLSGEYIVGTPDMNKTTIAAEAKKAGLPASIKLPTANIAGKTINNGTLAREFASYVRIHTLEATGGLTYAQISASLSGDLTCAITSGNALNCWGAGFFGQPGTGVISSVASSPYQVDYDYHWAPGSPSGTRCRLCCGTAMRSANAPSWFTMPSVVRWGQCVGRPARHVSHR